MHGLDPNPSPSFLSFMSPADKDSVAPRKQSHCTTARPLSHLDADFATDFEPESLFDIVRSLSNGSAATDPDADELPTSASDEIAKAKVEEARGSFDHARKRYWGEDGPFELTGEYPLSVYEALVATLESKWRFAYEDRKILLYGDPGDVHEEVIALLVDDIMQIDWSNASCPEFLRGRHRERSLFVNKLSAARKWRLTPSSPTGYCKEADALFVARTAKAKENGLAIEVAHCNETLPTLHREIQNWVSGDGERALLAVGFKINSKHPHQRDPLLQLLVRDSAPGPTSSITTTVFEFGHGTRVAPRRDPQLGLLTPLAFTTGSIAGAPVRYCSAADTTAQDLVVEVSIGAALFSDIQEDVFWKAEQVLLSPGYINHLRNVKWRIDLGYIRYQILASIRHDASA
ncbi:hypothetical protein C8R47DRAFT_1204770 [Mycena vitilis]|nr:hypothetical protein C8R47DRAFT_1204770 [Mycena vitilis]